MADEKQVADEPVVPKAAMTSEGRSMTHEKPAVGTRRSLLGEIFIASVVSIITAFTVMGTLFWATGNWEDLWSGISERLGLANREMPRADKLVGSARVDELSIKVMTRLNKEQSWIDLGEAFNALGLWDHANGCFAIGWWLNPTRRAERETDSQFWKVESVLQRLGVRDDEWIGDLGDKVASRTSFARRREIAHQLYEYALKLDPNDEEWQRKVRETPQEVVKKPGGTSKK